MGRERDIHQLFSCPRALQLASGHGSSDGGTAAPALFPRARDRCCPHYSIGSPPALDRFGGICVELLRDRTGENVRDQRRRRTHRRRVVVWRGPTCNGSCRNDRGVACCLCRRRRTRSTHTSTRSTTPTWNDR